MHEQVGAARATQCPKVEVTGLGSGNALGKQGRGRPKPVWTEDWRAGY